MTNGDTTFRNARRASYPRPMMTILSSRMGAAATFTPILFAGVLLSAPEAMAQEITTSPTDDAQVAQAEATQSFAIPAQALSSALDRFSEQTGISFAYTSSQLEDVRSPGVTGDLTPRAALTQLLTDTGVAFRFTGSDTVTLAKAEEQGGDRPLQLAPITVVGARESAYGPVEGYVANRTATGTKTNTPIEEVPQAISVITRDRMDNQGADSVSDVFRYTPGVKGEAFGNDTRVDFLRFRGFNDEGDAVFRDGLQFRSSAFGQFMPELYGIQRVDVLRGPSSGLFGLGSPGGLVNLVTKRPTTEFLAETELEFGNFDHFEGHFDIGGPIAGSQSVLFRLTGLGRTSDTQVDFVEDDRVYIAPALTFNLSDDTTFTILSHFQDDDTGSTNQFLPAEGTELGNPNGDIEPDTFTGNPDFDDFDRRLYSIGYLFDHRFNDTFKVSQSARYNKLDVDVEQVFGGGLQADLRTLNRFAFTADAKTDGLTIDTNIQANITTGPAVHTTLLGVDYQHYDFVETQGFGLAPSIDIFNPTFSGTIPSTMTFLDTDTEQDQIGLYLQDQVKVFDKWVLTLTGRHDWVDSDTENLLAGTTTNQDDSEFTGRTGLVYLSDIGLAPYVSYSESFQPTLGTNAQGMAFEPTTGEQYEAGIRYQPPGSNARITLTGFNIIQENVRTTDPSNPQNQIQTGEVRSRGLEIEANASLDFGLNLNAAYTYLDVEITESTEGDEGNRLSQVPRNEVSAWADYTLQNGPLHGLGFGAGIRYSDSTFATNANDLEVDGATLVDAAVFYDWRALRLKVRAENLFDDTHIASCSSAAACFFGPERRVFGSVSYRW